MICQALLITIWCSCADDVFSSLQLYSFDACKSWRPSSVSPPAYSSSTQYHVCVSQYLLFTMLFCKIAWDWQAIYPDSPHWFPHGNLGILSHQTPQYPSSCFFADSWRNGRVSQSIENTCHCPTLPSRYLQVIDTGFPVFKDVSLSCYCVRYGRWPLSYMDEVGKGVSVGSWR